MTTVGRINGPWRWQQTRRQLSAGAKAAVRKKAVEISGAPPSIASIRDHGFAKPSDGVVIREIGCTRRVFQLKPYLSTPQIEGLAYRIRTLTKNDALNSVLIAKDAGIEEDGLPAILHERNHLFRKTLLDVDDELPPTPDHEFLVSGGYKPSDLYKKGADHIEAHLTNLSNLALAVRGENIDSKIPTISVPNGHFHDGAFALYGCAGYVLATRETSFSIDNPSKGLSLDPVGLSYVLPRLGREFDQPAGEFTGCGMIMGLMGYKANAADMLETGLATNYLGSARTIGVLEHSLSEMRPWNQQALIKNPVQFHGQPKLRSDHNREFRNTAVASILHSITSYRADAKDVWTMKDDDSYAIGQDPSLDFDGHPWHENRSSNLVDYAATFDEIFSSESSLVGILERLKEVAGRETKDPEVQEGIDVARLFCTRLEAQSPLAVSAVYRLLREGSKPSETFHSCIGRERLVQQKLFAMGDFENWAEVSSSNGHLQFLGWKHKHIKDVHEDEVSELMQREAPQRKRR